MATNTPKLGLRKPEVSDLVDVVADLGDNYDKIDAAVGFEIVTAFPSAPPAGKGVMRSDDGYRSYLYNGTSPASGGWVEFLNSSGTFGSDVKLATGNKLVIGSDVNLYRDSANVLKTDDTFVAAVAHVTTGASAATNFSITTFDVRDTCGVVSILLEFTYSGTTITGGSTGNISDTDVCTFPAGYRPPVDVHAVFADGFTLGHCTLFTTGVVTLRALHTGGTVVSGNTYRATFVYVK